MKINIFQIKIHRKITSFTITLLFLCDGVHRRIFTSFFPQSQIRIFQSLSRKLTKNPTFGIKLRNFAYLTILYKFSRSFGVVFWEILEFAKQPYLALDDMQILRKIFVEKSEILPEPLVPIKFRQEWWKSRFSFRLYSFSETLHFSYKIIRSCMAFEAHERPTIDQILNILQYAYNLLNSNTDHGANFDEKWKNLLENGPKVRFM